MNNYFFCKYEKFNKYEFSFFIVCGILYFVYRFINFEAKFHFSYNLLIRYIIISPIIEEWLFRGIIQKKLMEVYNKKLLGIHISNILTSFLFSVMHLINSSLVHAILVFVPSLVFGHIYAKCGKIYPNVFLHSFYNLNVFII